MMTGLYIEESYETGLAHTCDTLTLGTVSPTGILNIDINTNSYDSDEDTIINIDGEKYHVKNIKKTLEAKDKYEQYLETAKDLSKFLEKQTDDKFSPLLKILKESVEL